MALVKMAPPWFTFYRKINALFEEDPEVRVTFDEDEMEIRIYVDNHVKAEALSVILPMTKEFGETIVDITVIPNNTKESKKLQLYSDFNNFEVAFNENNAVDMIKNVQLGSESITYVVFKKKVVQFFTDNLSDLHGMTSTLYESIAKEIFENTGGVFFCTNNNVIGSITFNPNCTLTSSALI